MIQTENLLTESDDRKHRDKKKPFVDHFFNFLTEWVAVAKPVVDARKAGLRQIENQKRDRAHQASLTPAEKLQQRYEEQFIGNPNLDKINITRLIELIREIVYPNEQSPIFTTLSPHQRALLFIFGIARMSQVISYRFSIDTNILLNPIRLLNQTISDPFLQPLSHQAVSEYLARIFSEYEQHISNILGSDRSSTQRIQKNPYST